MNSALPAAAAAADSAQRWFHALGVFLFRVALLLAGLYIFWRLRAVLTTVVIAAVFATAASAIVEPLCRRRPRFLSPRGQRVLMTSIVYLFLAACTLVSVQLVVQPFEREYQELQRKWPVYQTQLIDRVRDAQDWYNNLPPDIRDFLDRQRETAALPSPAEWLGRALGTTVQWATHIVELILIPVLAFYFTLDAKVLRNELLALVPRTRWRSAFALVREGAGIMRAYIIAQFWLAVIAGVVVGVALSLLGMQYALILGIFAGITRAIPVIGPILGGIPIVLLSFAYGAQMNRPLLWIEVLGFFCLLHLLESKLIMPKFLGHRLHLHAAVILIVLLIGGEFFGLIGMFLSVPVAALLRVLTAHYLRRTRAGAARPADTATAVASGTDPVLRLSASPLPPAE